MKELHGTHESAYEYDGASRRWRITEKENGTQTKQETFVWCGARICQKRSGGAVVRGYFGNGFQESGTTNYFYTRDHLGSVREVVGSDGATVASRLSYDPWGKATETGSGALSDFTYTGHHYDRATGLALTWFRAYDPNVGRWLSRDPIGIAGGFNLYGYVLNDPLNLFDPDGFHAAPPGFGFGDRWLRLLSEELYRASAWNFMRAGEHLDAGNYGCAALQAYFGTSLAIGGAIVQVAPFAIDALLMAEGGGGKGTAKVRPPRGRFRAGGLDEALDQRKGIGDAVSRGRRAGGEERGTNPMIERSTKSEQRERNALRGVTAEDFEDE